MSILITSSGKGIRLSSGKMLGVKEALPPGVDPTQDYDIVQTLTFASGSGTCNIRLYRGSGSPYTGTVYYRAGTSGAWTAKSVSGYSSTFPVTSTTMQVAHDWNKSGDNYMTCSFQNQSTNLTGIDISLKAVLSGVIGDYFMSEYARASTSLTSLSVPNTSNVSSVGYRFMYCYAYNCLGLTTLPIPDTSNISSVGSDFMSLYSQTDGLLTSFILPKAGYFKTNNVFRGTQQHMQGTVKGKVIDPADLADRQGLTTSGKTLYTNYIRSSTDVSVL